MLSRLVFTDLLILYGITCACGGSPAPGQVKPHRDVVTTQGVARGYRASLPPHYAFLGLPYARPPTRHDRFKAPEPPPRWDGIFEATYRVKCPQLVVAGDENCLVVNVFAPEHAMSLPVLVQVHDGDFHSGWGSFQPPARFIEEFVIVTFNYRIGALGFLCLGTSTAPGNAGLKDQVAALYWIQRNIARFGGDPSDITLYGNGAGATAIQILLLSGLAEGLLHKVIMDSGSALSPYSISYKSISTGYETARMLGYSGKEDIRTLVNFYQKIPAAKLVNVTAMFLPCIERNFLYFHTLLDMDPIEILQSNNFQKVPILISYTNEGLFNKNHRTQFDIIPVNFKNLLPSNLVFDVEETKHKVADLVKEFYFGDKYDREVKDIYEDYFDDVLNEYPIVKSAMLHAAKSTHPVYLMKFINKKNARNNEVDLKSMAKHRSTFDYVFAKDNLGNDDELTANRLMTMWRNFIKLSDPTPITTYLVPVIWQPVKRYITEDTIDISNVPQLVFDKRFTMNSGPHQRLMFWERVYRKFYKIHEHVVVDF